jgi:outer membrane protein OmpA-like peptidoglycan-associated protein
MCSHKTYSLITKLFFVVGAFYASVNIFISQVPEEQAVDEEEVRVDDIIWADELVALSDAVNYRGAAEILGEPSIMPNFGKSICAWLADPTHDKQQWITVKFPVHDSVNTLYLYESLNPGAVTNISALINGKEETFYFNNSPAPEQKEGIVKKIILPPGVAKATVFKIYINLTKYNSLPYQIDAVGVSKKTGDFYVEIDKSAFETKHYPVLLSEEINSQYIEIGPVISPSGDKLFFTRANDPSNIGGGSQDIYYAEKDSEGKFSNVVNIGSPLNNRNSNYVISVLPGGNELLVGNIYLPNGGARHGFSISKRIGNKWQFPQELPFKKYSNFSKRGTFCISPNRKVFISSIKYKGCRGELDLYVSFLENDSIWTEPLNMGSVLNTTGEEITPHIAPDGKTLYFSSDGFPGYGNQDIFVSERLDDTWLNWSKPKNLGYRLNSNAWDAFYTITASGKDAYYVSTVAGSNSDIFTLVMEDKRNQKMINPVALISGNVQNSKDSSFVGAEVVYEELPEGKEVGRASANPETGEFKVILPAGKEYGLMAVKENMASEMLYFDLRKLDKYKEETVNLKLVPIENKQIVRLNNVFFESGKYELLDESFPELNRVVKFLQNNPNVSIQINGHTDSVDSEKANLILSNNRASAVEKYLLSKGVNPGRISSKGFGETLPVATNSTPEGRQLNRRVEFEIIME